MKPIKSSSPPLEHERLHSLHNQVKQGDLAGVRVSLTRDPLLLDAANESGQNAFLLAKYYRQPEIAEYLLNLDPKLDVFSSCAAGRLDAVTKEIDRDDLCSKRTMAMDGRHCILLRFLDMLTWRMRCSIAAPT